MRDFSGRGLGRRCIILPTVRLRIQPTSRALRIFWPRVCMRHVEKEKPNVSRTTVLAQRPAVTATPVKREIVGGFENQQRHRHRAADDRDSHGRHSDQRRIRWIDGRRAADPRQRSGEQLARRASR